MFKQIDVLWVGEKYYEEDDRPVLLAKLSNADYVIRDRRGDWKYVSYLDASEYTLENAVDFLNPDMLIDTILEISYDCDKISKETELPEIKQSIYQLQK